MEKGDFEDYLYHFKYYHSRLQLGLSVGLRTCKWIKSNPPMASNSKFNRLNFDFRFPGLLTVFRFAKEYNGAEASKLMPTKNSCKNYPSGVIIPGGLQCTSMVSHI